MSERRSVSGQLPPAFKKLPAFKHPSEKEADTIKPLPIKARTYDMPDYGAQMSGGYTGPLGAANVMNNPFAFDKQVRDSVAQGYDSAFTNNWSREGMAVATALGTAAALAPTKVGDKVGGFIRNVASGKGLIGFFSGIASIIAGETMLMDSVAGTGQKKMEYAAGLQQNTYEAHKARIESFGDPNQVYPQFLRQGQIEEEISLSPGDNFIERQTNLFDKVQATLTEKQEQFKDDPEGYQNSVYGAGSWDPDNPLRHLIPNPAGTDTDEDAVANEEESGSVRRPQRQARVSSGYSEYANTYQPQTNLLAR